MQPLRNTSPPVNEEMKISSSGAGMSKNSPYISCASMMIGLGTPSAIGCVGSTVQTSSRSCSLRQRSVQVVPISLPKIFDQWPECSTTRPSPQSTCRCTRSTTSSDDLAVRGVPPPDQDVEVVEHLLGQAVLGFVEGGRA